MAPKPEPQSNNDLPAGGLVKREAGLIWRRRVEWQAADYRFIADSYRRLARDYESVAAAIEDEREKRYGKG